jgi:hypothetical protein
MSSATYYLAESDGSVVRKHTNGFKVALDEFEVVSELNQMRGALALIAMPVKMRKGRPPKA